MKKLLNFICTYRTHIVFYFFMLLLGGAVTLGHYGYCYKTGQFFSELDKQKIFDEIISWKVERSQYPRNVGYGDINYTIHYIPYKDIAHFKAVNPDCCKMMRHYSDGFDYPFARLTGKLYTIVHITYWEFIKYPNNIPVELQEYHPPAKQITDTYYISRCGDIQHWTDYQ